MPGKFVSNMPGKFVSNILSEEQTFGVIIWKFSRTKKSISECRRSFFGPFYRVIVLILCPLWGDLLPTSSYTLPVTTIYQHEHHNIMLGDMWSSICICRYSQTMKFTPFEETCFNTLQSFCYSIPIFVESKGNILKATIDIQNLPDSIWANTKWINTF